MNETITRGVHVCRDTQDGDGYCRDCHRDLPAASAFPNMVGLCEARALFVFAVGARENYRRWAADAGLSDAHVEDTARAQWPELYR